MRIIIASCLVKEKSVMPEILILYYSHLGTVNRLAQLIARGVESVPNVRARLRTVPKVSAVCEATEPEMPDTGAPYVEHIDLQECIGLALGSPCRFGNMAASMKYFWDGTTRDWLQGTLAGKPATVFTSSASAHGGNESTLLSMMLPLWHHGMVIVGIPPTETILMTTAVGGSPYGATHVAGPDDNRPIHDDERRLCLAQGKRLAEIALKLQG